MINGILFMTVETNADFPLLFGAIGNGIVYVTGMCYIFMQSDKRTRTPKIAAANFMYLAAFVGGLQLLKLKDYNENRMIFKQGVTLTIASTLSLCLVALKVYLSKTSNSYEYQKSLDKDFERENERKDDFYTALLPKIENNEDDNNNINVSDNRLYIIQNILTFTALLTRITTLIPMCWIFIVGATYASKMAEIEITYIYYLFIPCGLGALMAIPMTLYLSSKIIYLFGVLVYSITILIITILIHKSYFYQGLLLYYVFFFWVGLCYFCSPVFILEMANIKFTEAIFTASYLIEVLVVVVTKEVVSFSDVSDFIMNTTISLMGISILMAGTLILILYPKTKGRSILEIQHIILYNDYRPHSENVVINSNVNSRFTIQ